MRRPSGTGFDRQARTAVVVAALTMLLGGVGFRSAVSWLNVALRKEAVPLRRGLYRIPQTLGSWRGLEDLVLDEFSIEELGTDQYLNRAYVCEDGEHRGETVMVHIAYYTGMIDAVPHIPDRCFVAAGWEPSTPFADRDLAATFPEARIDPSGAEYDGEPYRVIEASHLGTPQTVRLPFGDPRLRMAMFSRTDDPTRALFGGYFFIANHRWTASPQAIRSLAFRLSEKHAYYVKIQFQLMGSSRDDSERFLAMTSDLVRHILPHLMRCLPDWSEVEAAATPDETINT